MLKAGCPEPDVGKPAGDEGFIFALAGIFIVAANEPKELVPMGGGTSALIPAFSPRRRRIIVRRPAKLGELEVRTVCGLTIRDTGRLPAGDTAD